MIACRICGNTKGNKVHRAKEMMFGYDHHFDYLECGGCGCLQIVQCPPEPAKYYGGRYYSFRARHTAEMGLKAFLRRQRAAYGLHGKGALGKLLSHLQPSPPYYEWLRNGNVTFESSILDVGCGAGRLLLRLYKEGFADLTGADPFIDSDIVYEAGLRILKKDMSELKRRFDLVMLHHSFEHMPDPLNSLEQVRRLLRPHGRALIRTPVAASFAWRKYGVNWVQLDAPRHLFLHTRKSIHILAKQAGLTITDVVYDSTELQFWGSEQYLRGIPLRAAESYDVAPGKSPFSKEDIAGFRTKADELNRAEDGDSACFYFRRT